MSDEQIWTFAWSAKDSMHAIIDAPWSPVSIALARVDTEKLILKIPLQPSLQRRAILRVEVMVHYETIEETDMTDAQRMADVDAANESRNLERSAVLRAGSARASAPDLKEIPPNPATESEVRQLLLDVIRERATVSRTSVNVGADLLDTVRAYVEFKQAMG